MSGRDRGDRSIVATERISPETANAAVSGAPQRIEIRLGNEPGQELTSQTRNARERESLQDRIPIL